MFTERFFTTFAMIDVLEDTKNIEEKDFEILHLFNVSAFSYVHKLINEHNYINLNPFGWLIQWLSLSHNCCIIALVR